MDKMKRGSELEDLLRDVATRRDQMLRELPRLSPARHAMLTDCLMETLPVEAALRDAATKRDQLLEHDPLQIPVSAHSALHRQLAAAEPARNGTFGPMWLRVFRRPLTGWLRASALIAAIILCLGRSGPSSRRAEIIRPTPQPNGANIESGAVSDRLPIGRADLFARGISIGPFNLNAKEPASLQASLLANSSVHFADGTETPFGLRLDLPARAFLTEDSLSMTP